MKNLLEQLDRMKGLMVYEKGTPINEISTKAIGTNQSKQTTTDTKSTGSNVEKKESGVNTPKGFKSAECKVATHTEPFGVSETANEGVQKFIDYFIQFLEKNYGNIEGGKLSITGLKVFGGASNKNRGLVKPEWCNEYDKDKGTTSLKKWSSGCEGFGTDGDTRYGKNDAGTKDNDRLSLGRAKSVLEGVVKGLEKIASENNIDYKKINPEEAEYDSGTVYTKDNVDVEPMPDGLNRGQIVMIDATVCFTKYDPKTCDDRCKDPNNDCKCKDGLKEVDGKCVCEDGSKPDENCKCPKNVKECGNCEKLNEETKECECKDGLVKVDGKCVCEDKDKVQQGCKCVNPIPCNFEKEISGGRGFKGNSYVSKKMENMPIPGDIGGKVTITLDSLVVPDAFYVRYGTKDETYFDEFSGFMGDVSNENHTQINLSPQEKKLMYKIQSPKMKDAIKKSIDAGDNDYSVMNRVKRNFIGELLVYKNDLGLLESIKNEISKYKGKTQVSDIFKNGDGKPQTITKNITDGKVSKKEGMSQYGNIMEKQFSFEIEKREGASLTILVFSPLSKTKFTLSVKCES
jgi:hypothetical protein